MKNFNIPVVLFLFKRAEKSRKIIEKLTEIRPTKIYLLSDAGRTCEEQLQVEVCRKTVEASITWDCEVIKRYAAKNIGIYENIAEGAKWVFKREIYAIFLEDDNFPEITFFKFCEDMLKKYEKDFRVLWVCGTNYLKEYCPADGSSYVFTKNMMPCGWASWSDKFIKFYDGELTLWKNEYIKKRLQKEYINKKHFIQDAYNFDYELDAIKRFGRFYSWDYQMALSMRTHNLYAIVPKYNQIKNIGVDSESTHGGKDLMAHRFCNLPTKPLDFPLTHPTAFLLDLTFEKNVSKIIVDPSFFKIKSYASRYIKSLFRINKTESLLQYLKGFLKK